MGGISTKCVLAFQGIPQPALITSLLEPGGILISGGN